MPNGQKSIDPNFGLKVALLLICLILLFLAGVVFCPVTENGNEHAKTIIPYLLSIFTIFVGFYWGASHEKSKNGVLTSPTTPVDVAAVEAAKVEAAKAVETAKTDVEECKDLKDTK